LLAPIAANPSFVARAVSPASPIRQSGDQCRRTC
jgi:hypothetical protein